MKVYMIQGSDLYDVTDATGGLSWSYDLDSLAGDLSVTVASEQFEAGDILLIKSGNWEVYRGIVISEEGKKQKSFGVIDLGWYLNKNELLIQFNNATVYDAILAVVTRYGIDVELPKDLQKVIISKLYKDEPVGDILRDLLAYATQTTGNRYHIRMLGQVLAIRTFHHEVIPITEIGIDYSRGKTIENMYNKVVIVSNEEASTSIYAEAVDEQAVARYGLLQMIETVEAEDISKARNIASNTLKAVNKIEENFSISCKGDMRIIAGSRVQIDDEPLQGIYVVKAVTHNYPNEASYRCDLTLERWETFVGQGISEGV